VAIAINAITTTTTLSSSKNPAVAGETVVLTASVSPAATGDVKFFDGGTLLSTVSLSGASQAVLTTSTLTPGTHSVTAVYGGDATHAASTSSVLSQVINQSTGAPAREVLYVATNGTPNAILQYDLPLSANSTPNFTNHNAAGVLAVNQWGDLAVVVSDRTMFFAAPISATSIPVQFTATGRQVVFTKTGHLLLSHENGVSIFSPPFSKSSTPTATIGLLSFPWPGPHGLAVDAANNLYVAVQGTSGPSYNTEWYSSVGVYTPPFTGARIITPGAKRKGWMAAAASSTHLFVVFTLPITNASTPSFSIPADAHSLAVDGSGNLYVGRSSAIDVYAPPFSASSRPITTMLPPGEGRILGIGITTAPAPDAITTTTALSSSTDAARAGQMVTLTANVSPAATGDVNFNDGTVVLGTATLNGVSQAVFTTTALDVGTHSVKAVYGGDATHAVSSSPAVTLVVNAGAAAIPALDPRAIAALLLTLAAIAAVRLRD
jgi:hypothetical protein